MRYFPHGFLLTTGASTAAIGFLIGLTGEYERGTFWLAIACFSMIVQRFLDDEGGRDGG